MQSIYSYKSTLCGYVKRMMVLIQLHGTLYRFKMLDRTFFSLSFILLKTNRRIKARTTPNHTYLRIVRLIPLFAVFDS